MTLPTQHSSNDIAVIGMSCRFPKANDVTALWKLLLGGEVTFTDITNERWNHDAFLDVNDVRAPDKTYVRKGAFIDGVEEFAALHYGLAPRRVQVMDPQQRLAIEYTRQALQDAGYDTKTYDKKNTGVFIGASVSEYKDLMTARHRAIQLAAGEFGDKLTPSEAEILKSSAADVAPARAFTIAGGLLNMIACSVAQTFDLNGPAMQIDAACSSALVAIHEASVNLRAGQCNLAIAGGVYLNLNPDNLVGFSRIGAISPSGACRPFDTRADGFVMGEGVGLVVLKRLSDAQRDGDRIYAVMRGSGCNNDGRGEGPMTPRPEGQIHAMEKAHREVSFPVDSIGYVETHGTATSIGDAAEIKALKEFFQARQNVPKKQDCYLGSIKGNVGHTMSAAGVAGFIKTCLMLHHQTIPPQPGIETINPKLELSDSPFEIATSPQPFPIKNGLRRAAVSSFGFGGTNAHVLLEQAPPVLLEAPHSTAVDLMTPELFVLSAPNNELLKKHAAEILASIRHTKCTIASVAQSLAKRQHFEARISFVANSFASLEQSLTQVSKGELQVSLAANMTEAKVAFLFPGQGAQRVGLLQDVTERFLPLKRALQRFDAAAEIDAEASIFDALYPLESVDAKAAQTHLTQTHICQPAMAALGISTAQFLRTLGVKPALVLGHSLGEFAAASVAGMLPDEVAVKLVAKRGRFMEDLKLADCGAMLAVMASKEVVEQYLNTDVAMANHNHPTQVVISGTTAGIEKAQNLLNKAGHKSTRLDVSHAFHSPLMNAVDVQMTQVVSKLSLNMFSVPVISGISGAAYTSIDDAKSIWNSHASAPVDFVNALKSCESAGITHYVQVGAGGALLSFARGVVTKPAHFLSIGSSDGSESVSQFLNALGQLWCAGIAVDVSQLVTTTPAALLPPTPLEAQKYWAMERVNRPARTHFISNQNLSNKGKPMDPNVLALFQQQMAILQSQSAIMQAQANAIAAMTGGTIQDFTQVAPLPNSPLQSTANAVQTAVKTVDFSNLTGNKKAEPVLATAVSIQVDLEPEVLSKIVETVSRISAFPKDSLKKEQTLVGELGFDSLMLVELDSAVGKTWPTLGGLPRELFKKETTVDTVVKHIVKSLEKPIEAVVDSNEPASPVRGYQAVVERAPLQSLSESVLSFSKPILVTQDTFGVAAKLVEKLKAIAVEATLGTSATNGDFSGVIHLEPLGKTSTPSAFVIGATEIAKRITHEKAELFVTVTSCGGDFGFAKTTPETLGQVGLIGFTKALSHEWSEVLVKAIDVDMAVGAEKLAALIVEELQSGDRTCEIGFDLTGRNATFLRDETSGTFAALNSDSVVLVTGGTKGLGLEFASALAKQYGSTFILAGRSEATTAAIGQVKSSGAKAVTSVKIDTQNAKQVEQVVLDLKTKFGRLDAVINSAGITADAPIEKKEAASIERVIGTKVTGAISILQALPELPLLVNIGSWAGRFGNAFQTDYAAANDMLSGMTALGGTTRVVSLVYPPFEDSDMVKKIPAFRKAELKAEGVTFISNSEGVAALLRAVKTGKGEIVVGRNLPAKKEKFATNFPVSRLNHIYLNDHTMAGQRVLPFASALDHVAAAALESKGKSLEAPAQFTVTNFDLKRTVMVPDTTWLDIDVLESNSAMHVKLSQQNALAYSGTVELSALSMVPAVTTIPSSALPLELSEFYSKFTFHGPKLQGITRIDGINSQGIVGWVKGCKPSDWVKEPLRNHWAIDPLLLDASFQLAGYWAWTQQQRAGFPVGFEKFVQVKPFGLGPVKCTVTFSNQNEDDFVGTLIWQNESQEIVAFIEGIQAEFKKRDPQFQGQKTEPKTEITVAEEYWNPEKFPEYEELKERIAMAEAFGLKNPYFSVHEAICGDSTVVNGKEMLNFSSYNYVGNSGDQVVSKAAKDAIEKYGTSVSASRVASGEKPLTLELERALADFFGTEDCIVLVSGHATNVTVIGHMASAGDLILHDALAHDSIIQGAKLSGAQRRPFPHNDYEALEKMIEKMRPHYKRVIIAIEGTYSMDGDIPDLPKFIEIKKKYKAMLLVDEAHSAGVVGDTGRGVGEYFNVNRADVDMWMGTLSKSFASCGGYIAGSKALVEYLKYTTPGFVYSVGIPPPNAAAALAATKQILAHPERVKKAKDNAAYFVKILKERGINTGMTKDTAVVPAIIGNSVLCLQVSDALKNRGINVQPILYPAVEDDQARLRFFVSSLHSEEQLLKAANTLKEEFDRLSREATGEAVA